MSNGEVEETMVMKEGWGQRKNKEVEGGVVERVGRNSRERAGQRGKWIESWRERKKEEEKEGLNGRGQPTQKSHIKRYVG
jgi:hypothetical protein